MAILVRESLTLQRFMQKAQLLSMFGIGLYEEIFRPNKKSNQSATSSSGLAQSNLVIDPQLNDPIGGACEIIQNHKFVRTSFIN